MNDGSDLPSALRRAVDDVLRPLVSSSTRIALLDFPSHTNVGDSAIWLGQLASLARVGAPAPCYTCDARTYDRRALAQRIGDGTILLSGGGNLGDLWETHQLFRERVIAHFPANPIVQLPQSIRFQSRETLARARAVLGRHSRFTLLVRDTESLSVARRELGTTSVLAPDMAFGLEPLTRVAPAAHEIVWLKRGDQEDRWAADDPTLRDAAPRLDWVGETRTPLIRLHDALSRFAARRPAAQGALQPLLSSAYPRLARARLDRGLRLLGSARVVVTDRLHGHILALLLGVPHVVLPDRNRKLRSFIDAWTSSSPLLRWADSPREVAALARELLSCA